MSQLGCPKCHVRPVAVGSTKACDECFEKLKTEVIEIALEIEENKRVVPAADRIRSALDEIDLELAPHLEARAALEGELEIELAKGDMARLEADSADHAAVEKARLEAEIAAEEAAFAEKIEQRAAAVEAEKARLEAEVKAEIASEIASLEAEERAKLAAQIADEEAAIALATVNDPSLTVS